MTLKIVRRIRGNVHGSIDISELEDRVLEHPYVQRLRRVKQLAFLHYVFPGATHTRFEHSLGVMHLASVAWNKLRVNQERFKSNLESISDFKLLEQKTGKDKIVHGLLSPTFSSLKSIFDSDYCLQVLRLAALLHDLGHPPFSHSGERFLPSWSDLLRSNPDISDYLIKYLKENIKRIESKGDDPEKVHVDHEVVSVLMVDKVLRDTYEQYDDIQVKIDPRDVVSIISGFDPAPDSPLVKYNVKHLCRELITGELDLDRMDYLLRDSRECGVVYGIFDAGRILDSLCIYFDPEDSNFHIAITMSGLAAFEDYLRARHSMYLQLYFHKSSVAVESMMQHLGALMGDWRLPASLKDFANCDEHTVGLLLEEAVDSLSSDNLKRECRSLIGDILYNRRLWKRVYEISAKTKGDLNYTKFNEVKRLLSDRGYTFGHISSATSLTRFRPRGENERSKNYLRLVKKDELQLPRIYPIEDFSSLISANNTVFIHRIYADPTKKDNKSKSVSLKQELGKLLK